MSDVFQPAAPRNRIEEMQTGQMVTYGDDRGLFVTFYEEAVPQPFESEKQGRPVFKQVDMIEMLQPGGKSASKRPVRLKEENGVPSDAVRFPRQWAAYKEQKEQVPSGYPLEQWPPVNKAQVLMLKGSGIHTVEQLSTVPDSNLQAIPFMDARKLRDLAMRFTENADGGRALSAANSEIAALKDQMAVMQSTIEALAANQKKKPGRKAADQDAEEGEE